MRQYLTRLEINDLMWTVYLSNNETINNEAHVDMDEDKYKIVNFGLTQYLEQEILLNVEASSEKLAKTSIHEIMLAYKYSYGISPETEEEWAAFLGNNIFNMMKLHEDIMKVYYNGQLKSERDD